MEYDWIRVTVRVGEREPTTMRIRVQRSTATAEAEAVLGALFPRIRQWVRDATILAPDLGVKLVRATLRDAARTVSDLEAFRGSNRVAVLVLAATSMDDWDRQLELVRRLKNEGVGLVLVLHQPTPPAVTAMLRELGCAQIAWSSGIEVFGRPGVADRASQREVGADTSQYDVLEAVLRSGAEGIRVRTLARALSIPQSRIDGVVEALRHHRLLQGDPAKVVPLTDVELVRAYLLWAAEQGAVPEGIAPVSVDWEGLCHVLLAVIGSLDNPRASVLAAAALARLRSTVGQSDFDARIAPVLAEVEQASPSDVASAAVDLLAALDGLVTSQPRPPDREPQRRARMIAAECALLVADRWTGMYPRPDTMSLRHGASRAEQSDVVKALVELGAICRALGEGYRRTDVGAPPITPQTDQQKELPHQPR